MAIALLEKQRRLKENALARYRPYAKQLEFHDAGRENRERLLMAGNQLGKTLCAGAETAMHLTGRYPSWWTGRVFNREVNGWVAGVTGEATRDGAQRMLFGRMNAIGTGLLPKDAIKDIRRKSGVADAVDFATIRFGGGGDVQARESLIGVKSYDQGREKFQAETLHLVWLDEEPPSDIYSESLTRTNATGGMAYMTFTPLMGVSDVVKRFMLDRPVGTVMIQMTIEDAEHYSPEQRAAIVAAYPEHEREARAKGIPDFGSGRVFPISEEQIIVEPFQTPDHWPSICGLDFGYDHPTAAVRLVWDRDADVLYLVSSARQRLATPVIFAPQVRSWGAWMPWAWPHDGYQHDRGSGIQLAAQYREHGMNMLPEHATHDEGGYGTEAGITEMLERMQTNRFKVFRNNQDWLEEFRLYHRVKGLIHKQHDDLMSATRIAVMMRRKAAIKPTARRVSDKVSYIADRSVGY
jgi:phage terminase large subunit-like protein